MDGEIEVGEAEVVLEPVEECGLEDSAGAVEGVAGQPDQFRFVQAELARGFQLLAKLADIHDVSQGNVVRAIHQGEGGAGGGVMFPDELEHQELVKIGIEERARDGIELPVMVVCAAGQVNNHGEGIVFGRGWRGAGQRGLRLEGKRQDCDIELHPKGWSLFRPPPMCSSAPLFTKTIGANVVQRGPLRFVASPVSHCEGPGTLICGLEGTGRPGPPAGRD